MVSIQGMTVYGLIRLGDCPSLGSPSLGKDFDISMAFMPPGVFSFFAVYIAGTVPKPGNPLNGYLWWFRKVEGWVPKEQMNPNNGQQEKVLILWRKLTGDMEKDNLMLDEWFKKNRINTRDFEFDTIYVNGSNNLPNLKLENENWKVRLIEEEFMKRMWDVEGS